MNFRYGPPPKTPLLLQSPQLSAKSSLFLLNLYGVLAGVGLCTVIVIGFDLWPEFIDVLKANDDFVTYGTILILPLIHELCHALAYACLGLTKDTQLGVLPSGGIFYTFSPVPVLKWQYIFALLLPLVILSVIPLMTFLLGHVPPLEQLLPLILFNVLFSGGDIYICYRVCIDVPATARIQSSGMSEYWGG
jgi:hypothetical protein